MGLRPAYFEALLNYLRRKGRSREDAEDLIQEAMLRLHVYARSTTVINAEAFLRRAVHNLSIDLHRSRRPDLYKHVSIDGIHPNAEWLSGDSTPQDVAEKIQSLEEIDALLAAAGTRTRDTYIASRCGYTHNEIAYHMNISSVTVRRHIARALRIVTQHQQTSGETEQFRAYNPYGTSGSRVDGSADHAKPSNRAVAPAATHERRGVGPSYT